MSKSKIKKLNKLKKMVLEYVNLVEEKFPVREAYLYGSHARGTDHKDSDIDVCVVSDKFKPNYDKDRLFLWQKRRGLDYRIEPVGFNTSDFVEPDPLVYEIKKFGIRVV